MAAGVLISQAGPAERAERAVNGRLRTADRASEPLEADAVRVARQLQVGTVNINESYAATWTSTASPIGGMKESGFGRRHGAQGILKYTETQTIATQRGIALAPLPGMSEPTYGRVMPALLRVMRRLPGLR